MASQFLSLEEAAQRLGLTTEKLVDLRSQGEIRGFRDGASWKFPEAEIERVRESMDDGSHAEVLDGPNLNLESSDVGIGNEHQEASELKTSSDSMASRNKAAASSSSSTVSGIESRGIKGGSRDGDVLSELELLSELDLVASHDIHTGELLRDDSSPAIGFTAAETPQKGEKDDDLVLGLEPESDVLLAGNSGINLTSPSDSGLSLEGEPLDLAGANISSLDLGSEIDATESSQKSGLSSGSLIDFQADEDFQLSPSTSEVHLELDDDSGSQVIEIEDSSFGSGVNLGDIAIASENRGLEDTDILADDVFVADEMVPVQGGGLDAVHPSKPDAVRPAYEVPFSVFNVVSLASVLLVLSIGGMLMTDLMRNMWAHEGASAPVSSLTDTLVEMAGLDP